MTFKHIHHASRNILTPAAISITYPD